MVYRELAFLIRVTEIDGDGDGDGAVDVVVVAAADQTGGFVVHSMKRLQFQAITPSFSSFPPFLGKGETRNSFHSVKKPAAPHRDLISFLPRQGS